MKFKNEHGRSMVEMLGVLAIIGVLSIGGVTGYKMTVDAGKMVLIFASIKKQAF